MEETKKRKEPEKEEEAKTPDDCCVCFKIAYDPQILSCGHGLCSICLATLPSMCRQDSAYHA
jgi:hypothetical protein